MWTAFPELDEVLAAFVEGVRSVLGDDLVGVYLQGSFAVGDADEWSDVDFIVVTDKAVTEDDAAALQAVQERVYELPSPLQHGGRSLVAARARDRARRA